ncbi:uncharacterized protein LOC143552959 [Bidens hawaiensis]|uniref:uncharacterized protein LOC143552959 n=1 Tax=Bidens hawaiensis TaxID=980011 RepID=UPI00404A2C62
MLMIRYPVAWAIVEGENNDSWDWFMTELKKCLDVTDEGKGWTLVSDQQKSNVEHRNCARHIYANWHKKFKGDELKELYWRAARAYNEADHKIALEDMTQVKVEAYEAFINQNPKCFCMCYIQTHNKSDVIVSNMAETFNGYIIKSRSKHIIDMLEDIRVQKRKLDREKDKAYMCSVYLSSNTVFQVKSYDDVSVDIKNRTCTCRKWDLTGIPCYHACVVVGFMKRNAEDLFIVVTQRRCISSHMNTIPPLPSEKYWPCVKLPLDPPPIKIGPGRPKKNRKKDPHETKKPGKLSRHGMLMTCKNCNEKGHNKSSCSKLAPESSQVSRKRGRPKKSVAATQGNPQPSRATQQASQTTQQSQPSKRLKGKAIKSAASQSQPSQATQQSSQGQAKRGRPKKVAKTKDGPK